MKVKKGFIFASSTKTIHTMIMPPVGYYRGEDPEFDSKMSKFFMDNVYYFKGTYTMERYQFDIFIKKKLEEQFPDLDYEMFVYMKNSALDMREELLERRERLIREEREKWEYDCCHPTRHRDTSTGEEWEVDSDGCEYYP